MPERSAPRLSAVLAVMVPASVAYTLSARRRTVFSPPAPDTQKGFVALAASRSLAEIQQEIAAVKAERERVADEAAAREIDLRAKRKALEELVTQDDLKHPGKDVLYGEKEGNIAVSVIEKTENGRSVAAAAPIDEECILEEDVKEPSETEKLLKKVKESGTAGVISYALWELVFWTISVPVCVFAYRQLTGHWPDLSDKEDLEKLGAEAFAFVNFARFAVPLRIGLALSTAPWIEENVVNRFMKKDEPRVCEPND